MNKSKSAGQSGTGKWSLLSNFSLDGRGQSYATGTLYMRHTRFGTPSTAFFRTTALASIARVTATTDSGWFIIEMRAFVVFPFYLFVLAVVVFVRLVLFMLF